MLKPEELYSVFREQGYRFFTGVPDSLLKEFCAYIAENTSSDNHVITANEGAAIALAAGYHLGTGEAALVYMQNSGTGNAINPLLSLADPAVYGFPMLLLIGWRGEPGVKDEPQHVTQGFVQEELIRALGYPYEILEPEFESARSQIQELTKAMRASRSPVILLVRAGTFDRYQSAIPVSEIYPLTREEVLALIVDTSSEEDRFVSTTGRTSRELFEIRDRLNQGHERDFLTVGSMGHAPMIALGLAMTVKRTVYCIDGDGAALMHFGNMAIVGSRDAKNLRHFLINNGAHDSVGGQPTVGYDVPFHEIADRLGYRTSRLASTETEIREAIEPMNREPGPHFLEIRVRAGTRKDLGRPTTTPLQNKNSLMKGLK